MLCQSDLIYLGLIKYVDNTDLAYLLYLYFTGRNRNRDKQPKLINEDHKTEVSEESIVSQMDVPVSEQKKETTAPHPKVQPTTEQLMIAKIIDRHSDDPDQQKKIGQVV